MTIRDEFLVATIEDAYGHGVPPIDNAPPPSATEIEDGFNQIKSSKCSGYNKGEVRKEPLRCAVAVAPVVSGIAENAFRYNLSSPFIEQTR